MPINLFTDPARWVLSQATGTYASSAPSGQQATSSRMLRGRGLLAGLVLAATAYVAVPAAAQQATDSDLATRIEQLEQQIIELQVTIGTLETLAKGSRSGGGRQVASGGSADVTQLEIQMRAMSGQLAALSSDVRALQQGGGVSSGTISNNSYVQPLAPLQPGLGQATDGAVAIEGFGSTTVTAGDTTLQPPAGTQAIQRDPIGNILSSDAPQTRQQVAAASALPPRAAYDRAYGFLLEQDYGAAEVAFGEFVQQHPKSELAGNAQYWLGESHYVRGNYRAAANAFLRGYKTYNKSAKAPDSLLKLAMSLSRLGQKPSACATFKELGARFPNAPSHVASRSNAERQRAGC